jgi:hypothetical protein
MSLQSTFESLPLDELLLLLASTAQTGVLHFAGDQPCDVWIDDGQVVGVHRADDTPLGEALVSGGAIPAPLWQHLSAAGPVDLSAAVGEPDVRGALVEAIVRDRIVDGLFPLLLVPDASFVFQAGVAAPNGSLVRIDSDRAMADARQRLTDWTAIARTVGSLEAVVSLAPQLPDGSGDAVVPAADWPVFTLADGRRTLGEMVRETGLSAFAVCSTVHRLVQTGLLVTHSG